MIEEKDVNFSRAIQSFQEYMKTYHEGICHENLEVFLNDVIYGLGRSLHETKYTFANGYFEFLKDLRDHCDAELEKHRPLNERKKEPLILESDDFGLPKITVGQKEE